MERHRGLSTSNDGRANAKIHRGGKSHVAAENQMLGWTVVIERKIKKVSDYKGTVCIFGTETKLP